MLQKRSFLHSGYIIDGIRQALTPADILRGCSAPGVVPPSPEPAPELVADEHPDMPTCLFKELNREIGWYCDALQKLTRRSFPFPFAAEYTCGRVAAALIDAIWMCGHFRLEDLTLKAEWKWNDQKIGNMTAFYQSVEAASEYIDALGLRINALSVGQSQQCSAAFRAGVSGEEPLDAEEEEGSATPPRLSKRRKCPGTLLPEASDWLIYIPFDPCGHRLGGSALAEATGETSSTAPDIGDADYFKDCFEVVRELVGDGVVRAGGTVFDGGLMSTLRAMSATCGAEISINDVCRFYGETIPLRVLFGEVPGVVVQIADIDYDYVGAELLLQDVAYFPLGHPVPGDRSISVLSGGNYSISGILDSLLNTLEGED